MADSDAMCTVVVSLTPEAPVPLLLLGIRDEFTGRPAMFHRLDADRDGFVTVEEARAFARNGGQADGTNKEAAPTTKP